jgi:hypothetical protein
VGSARRTHTSEQILSFSLFSVCVYSLYTYTCASVLSVADCEAHIHKCTYQYSYYIYHIYTHIYTYTCASVLIRTDPYIDVYVYINPIYRCICIHTCASVLSVADYGAWRIRLGQILSSSVRYAYVCVSCHLGWRTLLKCNKTNHACLCVYIHTHIY